MIKTFDMPTDDTKQNPKEKLKNRSAQAVQNRNQKPSTDQPLSKALPEIDWPVKHNRCLKILTDGVVIFAPAYQWEATLAACAWDMCGLANQCERGELKDNKSRFRRK